MTRIAPPLVPPRGGPAKGTAAAKDEALRHTAQQMEGAFVEELYKAMRASAPSEGLLSGGSGEDMFTSLMDQRLAAETPGHWHHGLADALYRRLRESGSSHPQHGAAVPAATTPDRS